MMSKLKAISKLGARSKLGATVGVAAGTPALLAAVALLATATPAAAASIGSGIGSNYTFPNGSPGFALNAFLPVGDADLAMSSFLSPEVLVGFNPQPDPPGFSDVVDLANRMDPSIGFSTGTPVTTTIVFGMHGPGSSDPYSASPGLFTSNSDGTRYVFDETGDGSVFQVTFDISGYTGGFNSFNPQPDPPGDVGFVFTGDPMMHFHIDLQLPGAGLAPLSFIPEPASLGLLMMGVGGLMGLRRKAVG